MQLVVIKSIGSTTFIRIAQENEKSIHATTNSNVKVYFTVRKNKSGSKYRQPCKLYKYFQNPIHIRLQMNPISTSFIINSQQRQLTEVSWCPFSTLDNFLLQKDTADFPGTLVVR